MIFSSAAYLLFFVVVALALHFVRALKVQKAFLLLASYYFYAYWDYRFVLLILGMSFANYVFGLQIERSADPRARKRWLIVSVIVNLVILGIFKYYNFFIETANELLDGLGVRFPYAEILLPIGISFITFEVMSYTIDIYRKTNKSPGNFWDLALLVAFFPHLIAGPILKPSHFLPQLEKRIVIKWANLLHGGQIFLFGLVKKVLIADRLALFVDPVFQNPAAYSSPTVALAVLAYAVQIYCDFSGYSDMAIGSARALGFEIPKNFSMPYVSRNITEFWRRWHISLSSWLREYLYISLGGNRKGKARQYANLFIVMLLGGLWHGASWNFVIWGGLHGLALAVHKVFMEYRPARMRSGGWAGACASWLITFVFVCLAWVFFRSSDLAVSWLILKKLLLIGDTGGIHWFAASLWIILPLVVIAHAAGKRLDDYWTVHLTTFRGLLVLFIVLLGLLFLTPMNPAPFIYFQF